MHIDKLACIKGDPLVLSPRVSVRIPLLGEIVEFGEENYFSKASLLTSTSFDHKLMLYDAGIDYETVDDYTMFLYTSPTFTPADTSLILGDLDLSKLEPVPNDATEDIVLCDNKGNIVIDRGIYMQMVEFIRYIHGFERNYKVPGNEATKRFYIEDDRREAKNPPKPYKSILAPIISALCNSPHFKYNYNTVWNLNIFTLFDSLARIQILMEYESLMTGIYTGNIDAKGLNKNELNWLREK